MEEGATGSMELSFAAWRRDDRAGHCRNHQPVPTSAEALVTDLPVVATGPVVVVEPAEPALQDPRNRKRDAGAWWTRPGGRQCLLCSVLAGLTVLAVLLVPTNGDVGDRVGLSFSGGTTLSITPTKSPPFPPPGGTRGYPPPPDPSPPPPPHPPPNVSPPAVPPLVPAPAQPPCESPTEDCNAPGSLGCCEGSVCEETPVEISPGVINDEHRCVNKPRGPPPPPAPPPRPLPPPSLPEIVHPTTLARSAVAALAPTLALASHVASAATRAPVHLALRAVLHEPHRDGRAGRGPVVPRGGALWNPSTLEQPLECCARPP